MQRSRGRTFHPSESAASPQRQFREAAERRDEAIERGLSHADRVKAEWRRWAYNYFKGLVALTDKPFLAEDLIEKAEREAVWSPAIDRRHYGGVIRALARDGVIEKIGYANARTSNCSPRCLWKAKDHALTVWGDPLLALDKGQNRQDTHKQTHTSEWGAWASMKERCLKPTHEFYHRYGGRGITICQRLLDAKEFLIHLGKKPTPAHSLDRKDNNGGYWCGKCEECVRNGWPNNVRWATQIEQSNNTESNVLVTYGNKTLTMTQWARRLNVPIPTLFWRKSNGRTDEEILTGSRDRVRRSHAEILQLSEGT